MFVSLVSVCLFLCLSLSLFLNLENEGWSFWIEGDQRFQKCANQECFPHCCVRTDCIRTKTDGPWISLWNLTNVNKKYILGGQRILYCLLIIIHWVHSRHTLLGRIPVVLNLYLLLSPPSFLGLCIIPLSYL